MTLMLKIRNFMMPSGTFCKHSKEDPRVGYAAGRTAAGRLGAGVNGQVTIPILQPGKERRSLSVSNSNRECQLAMLLLLRAFVYSDLREAISIEKRYLTSDLSSRSEASLTFWMGMTSTSAVMLCAPQKSSISWVSAMPPMAEPERLRRPMIRANAATLRGLSGAPTRVRV